MTKLSLRKRVNMSLEIRKKETLEVNLWIKTKKQADEMEAITILARNRLVEINPDDPSLKITSMSNPVNWHSLINFCDDLGKLIKDNREKFIDG